METTSNRDDKGFRKLLVWQRAHELAKDLQYIKPEAHHKIEPLRSETGFFLYCLIGSMRK